MENVTSLDSFLETVAFIRDNKIKCPLIEILIGNAPSPDLQVFGPILINRDGDLDVPGAFDTFVYITSIRWNIAPSSQDDDSAPIGVEKSAPYTYSDPLHLFMYTGPDDESLKGKGRPVYHLLKDKDDTKYLYDMELSELDSFVKIMRRIHDKCPIFNDYLMKFVPRDTIIIKFIKEKIIENVERMKAAQKYFFTATFSLTHYSDAIIFVGDIPHKEEFAASLSSMSLNNIKNKYSHNSIFINRAIVAAGSEYFRRRCSNAVVNNKSYEEAMRPTVIFLFPEEKDVFLLSLLLEYLYGGSKLFNALPNFNNDELGRLVHMINYLQIHGLCNYFDLDISNDKEYNGSGKGERH